ncbi:MAG TPA: hypothetical protein VN240_09785 [Propylenella sp.]|nr:hypothetical protein [Propylenella sp.]
MVSLIRCDVAPDAQALAASAAEWAQAFYPDVDITREAGSVALACESRGEGELRLIWRSALANDKLFAGGAAQRAAVLDALVR